MKLGICMKCLQCFTIVMLAIPIPACCHYSKSVENTKEADLHKADLREEFLYLGEPTSLLSDDELIPVKVLEDCTVPSAMIFELSEIVKLLMRIPWSGIDRKVEFITCWESIDPVAVKVEMSDCTVFLTRTPVSQVWRINYVIRQAGRGLPMLE